MSEVYPEDMIEELSNRGKELEDKNFQLTTGIAGSNFNQGKENNPIEYQVENAELLSKIEHFLKGDLVKIDEEGNEYYETPKDEELILLNEYGVTSLMGVIGGYIDKNTTLSWYDESRIYEILADLGDEVTNFVFCNYEKMGLNTEFKRTRYNLLVLQIIQMIESAYRKALLGKQSDTLNSSRIFTQHESGYNRMPIQQTQKKRFNPFSPKSW